MVNQDKGKAEQFVLRGNADSIIRQLVDEYNSSNGWQVNRIVNNILNFTVVLERNTKQGASKDATKDTSKAVPTEKVVDADATASDEQLKPSTGTTQPLETKELDGESKPVAVKTTRKSASKGQDMYGKLVISLTKNKEGWEL